MAERDIPLEHFAPPPQYQKRQGDGPEPIHNHYHIATDHQAVPWYRQRWALCTMLGLLAVLVIAGLVTMGVVLKRSANAQLGTNQASGAGSPATLDPSESISISISSSASASAHNSKQPQSTLTTSETQSTATPFTMLDKSQLASAYVKASDATRIKDRLSSFPTEPKPGTPLALQADASGTLHLFYLSSSNIISYVYEQTAGKWKSGQVSNEHGAIRTSASSSLSTAVHNGVRASDILVVAYDNPSQQLQLAMTDRPMEQGSWYLADVTSVSGDSVPGQSNVPCYSLAGDWYVAARKASEKDNQNLMIAVVEGSEMHAWECTVDYWPPPEVQIKCKEANERFRDGGGKNLTLVPPPKQLAWVSLNDGQDKSSSNYDFVLLSQDGSGTVHESSVGAGITRGAGTGFTAKMPVRAISTTSEGLVFASSGKDVFVYKKIGSRWQPDVGTNVTFQA